MPGRVRRAGWLTVLAGGCVQEVEALVTGHMEWRAAELEKRRLQLKEANAERLRAMRCRVEEAEEQAVAMAAQLEDEEVRRHVAGGWGRGLLRVSDVLTGLRVCCMADGAEAGGAGGRHGGGDGPGPERAGGAHGAGGGAGKGTGTRGETGRERSGPSGPY